MIRCDKHAYADNDERKHFENDERKCFNLRIQSSKKQDDNQLRVSE